MQKKGKTVVRLNIYLPDLSMRRRVKTAAATRDLSISEYCVRAIASQLAEDEARGPGEEEGSARLGQAVRRARRFQAGVFGGRLFSVSSAELIEEARGERNLRDGNRGR